MNASPPTVPDIASSLAERLGRGQVFGPPVVQGDTTLLPVARVRSGGGSGRGGDGDGGGAGISARPLGAFSLTADGRVSWHPVVDVNMIVLGGQLAVVAIVALSVGAGRRLRSRRRAERRGLRRSGTAS